MKTELPVHGERRQCFLATDYEPGIADDIRVSYDDREDRTEAAYKIIWFDQPQEREKPKQCAQDFVIVKKASSFLAEHSFSMASRLAVRRESRASTVTGMISCIGLLIFPRRLILK